MRYILEKAEVNFKEHGVHAAKIRFRWREVASSNDVEMLIGIAGEMDRIKDIVTGNILYRATPESYH